MDNTYTAHFTISCWGCNKSVTRGYHDYEDSNYQTELLKKDGWRRHVFGPGADPWFCSEDCELHSRNAVYAKEWWGNHFVNERKNKRLLLFALFALPFVIIGIVLMSVR
jgi:hypothetical protein